MQIVLVSLILVAAVLSGRGEVRAIHQNSSCRTQEEPLLSDLRMMMGDPELQELRDSLRLPEVPDSLVRLITQDSVCALAANAYSAAIGDSVVGRRVFVFELGPQFYAVIDPTVSAGEWGRMVIITRQFVRHEELLW